MEDMQMQSEKNGNSKMSMKEINALIADARKPAFDYFEWELRLYIETRRGAKNFNIL
jgi:hypothetical protein